MSKEPLDLSQFDKRAPVQGFEAGIPWEMHLRAYDAYCKKWAPQKALIDLEGRNCRGGFSVSALDEYIPNWREELSERTTLLAEVKALREENERLSGCRCVDVEIQTYTSQVLLAEHPTMKAYFDNREREFGERPSGIPVDSCLALEITQLWGEGIKTYGCCCGHNTHPSMINIGAVDIPKALGLGYEIFTFKDNPERKDTIIPKSVNQALKGTTP